MSDRRPVQWTVEEWLKSEEGPSWGRKSDRFLLPLARGRVVVCVCVCVCVCARVPAHVVLGVTEHITVKGELVPCAPGHTVEEAPGSQVKSHLSG